MTCFCSGFNSNMQSLRDGEKLFFDYSDITRTIYAKTITLSKELELCLLTNYPLRKYIQF